MKTMNQSDVIYRSLKEPFSDGVVACGFMIKSSSASSQINFCIDYYSCFVVLTGKGIYRDVNNHEIPIEAGDIVQRLPGLTHTTEINTEQKWTEFFISFGKPVYDYLTTLNLLNIDSPVLKSQGHEDYSQILSYQTFLKQLKESDSKDLFKHLLTAQKLVLKMQSQALYHQTLSQPLTKLDSYEESISYACDRLSTQLQENLDYQELARSLNMSYENFRKLFKSTTGLSPAKYHTNEKMKQGLIMIKSGLTIREVALLTGYSDVFAFSKQFKKTMGITPGSINT